MRGRTLILSEWRRRKRRTRSERSWKRVREEGKNEGRGKMRDTERKSE